MECHFIFKNGYVTYQVADGHDLLKFYIIQVV